jgi:hypothetical protein
MFVILSNYPSIYLSMYSGLLVLPALAAAVAYTDCKQGDGSLHDFELTTLDGSRNVSLSEYAGTFLLESTKTT